MEKLVHCGVGDLGSGVGSGKPLNPKGEPCPQRSVMKATRARAKTWRKWSWDFYLGIQCCMEGFLKSLLPLLLLLLLPITIHAQFNYTTNDDDTITITRYTGPGGDVTIPNAMNGLPVTSIGDYAFFHCTSLTDITIPNSVTSIGQDAFFYCTSLTNVMIPDSVTNIGVEAFTICSSLTRDNGGCAQPLLQQCGRSLVQRVPDHPRRISRRIGRKLHDPQQRHQHRERCVLLLHQPDQHHDTQRRHQHRGLCVRELLQPDRASRSPTASSASGAVRSTSCISLTNVTIPDSVTSIGGEAFYDCTSLTSVIIPNSVTSTRGLCVPDTAPA